MSHRNIPTKGKRGPRQAHLNKVKFDPKRYRDQDQLPDKSFLAVMNSLCCRRCCEKLQWKVEFAKYEPLEIPKRCNGCSEKVVAIAYHHMCQQCARERAVCAKCCRSPLNNLLLRDAGEGQDSGSDEDDDDEPRGARSNPAAASAPPANGTASSDQGVEVDDGKPKRGVSRFAYVDEPCSDDEFALLRGLEISRLRAHKRKLQALEEQAARERLRERERRTVVRNEEKAKQAAGGGELILDSDEEEL